MTSTYSKCTIITIYLDPSDIWLGFVAPYTGGKDGVRHLAPGTNRSLSSLHLRCVDVCWNSCTSYTSGEIVQGDSVNSPTYLAAAMYSYFAV